MPKFSKAVEREIRDFLVAKAKSVLPGVIVINTPTYWASQQDFAGWSKQVYDEENFYVNYLMFSYAGFTDSKRKGCDEDPSVFITYKMQLFREFQEALDNRPNSHDIIVDQSIDLRNRYLVSRDIQQNHIVHDGLVQVGSLVEADQCRNIAARCLGDWFNFTVNVEIN